MPRASIDDLSYTIGKLVEASNVQKDTLDTIHEENKENIKLLIKAQNQFMDVNREEHKAFTEAISELRGWKKWLIGVTVGVSGTISALTVILGFIIKVGAYPVSVYPEAEAADKIKENIENIVDTADLYDVSPPAPEEDKEEGAAP